MGAEFWRGSRCHCRGFALRSERRLESPPIFRTALQFLCQDLASANDPAGYVRSYVKPTSVINRNVPMIQIPLCWQKQSGTDLKEKRTAGFFFSFSNSRVHPSLHFCARTTVCQIREARVALVFTSYQCGPGSYVGCLLRQEFFFYVKYIGNNSFLNFQLFFFACLFFFCFDSPVFPSP